MSVLIGTPVREHWIGTGLTARLNFVVFVHSSLSVIANAITAPDVIAISGPSIENCPAPGRHRARLHPEWFVRDWRWPNWLASADHVHARARVKRPSMACFPCSMLVVVRSLWDAMALTVASVFLMR